MYAPLNLANEQRTLTRNEYRIFTDFINDKYEDMYSEKVGYVVNYNPSADTFKVTLPINNVISFVDLFNERG
tara:strand:- start:328 stop:543 length:216 start_codon:yes stop_codon:yes gene_type:complete